MTTITIGVNTSTISTLAFAELFQNATRDANVTSGAIDIVINIGGGNVIIETGAFSNSNSNSGVTINSATINFSADPQNPTIPTLGSNFASGLPIRTLILPAQTTLEPNALQNLQDLQHLDASLLTNPVPSNGLNLTRTTTVPLPLIISMPTREVSFGSNAVVIPPTGTGGNTTTLVFNGFVPSTTQLSQMFSIPTTTAPIQVSLNYSSSSGTSNAQLTALSSSLNNNVVAVSFNQVQNVLQGLTHATSIAPLGSGSLTSASVFAGEIFDSIVISPKANKDLLQLKQVVLTSLSSAAIKSNIQNIPIPSSIKTGDIERSVVGLVPKMNIPVTDLTSTAFYIMDNYIDPSDTLLPPVPLIAIFSKENAGSDASFGKFFPALRCNGTITVSNEGTVVVSGRRDQDVSYCWGYKSVSGDGDNRDSQNLLLENPAVGSVIPIYDRGTNPNALPIANITYPTATTFEVHFKPIAPFDNQATSSTDLILGCMQGYMPTGTNAKMVVDFTNIKNEANAAWSAFSTAVANLIARNNALKAQIADIRNFTLPQGTNLPSPMPSPMPTVVVDISPQLTALSNSDFSLAFSNWKTLESSYGAYNTYLEAVKNYVNAVIGATLNSGDAAIQSTNAAFTVFQTALESAPEIATGNLLAVRAQLKPTDGVDGVAPIFTSVIKNYINRRLSIGRQTFKSCTVLDAIPNFDSLRNISQINDETFYFCTVMSDPINIPVNVVSIGARAFQHCIGAASIDIQGAFALRTIGDSAFETCQKADGNLSFSCAIGQLNSVERIGNRAFYGCMKLTGNMYFPPGLKSLGVSAFEKCESLNGTIVFPDKPDSDFSVIPNNAFADCKNVTGISTNTGNGTSLSYIPGYRNEGKPIPNGLILPANIKKIGENAFSGCAKFAGALNLQQQGSVIESIGDRAFQGCSAFTSLSLPTTSTYTIVATECFRGCNKLTNLVIPANVIYILDGAFRGCTQISKVPLLDNIATIGNDAFNGCIVMSGALVLGENLVLLGDRAFFDCIMLTSATFMGPRPEGLGQATLIFGAEAGASTTFYVNVFTENGWNVNKIATPNDGGVIINNSFRALALGNKSLVHMAYIDFNTHVPHLMSREITLNQFNAFKVYANTGTTTNDEVAAPSDGSGHSWNDVILPSTLIGKDLAEAGLNFNSAPAIQSLVTSLISPKIDAVQTAAINASFGSNHLLNALDGRNFEVTTIQLAAKIASIITATGTGPNWYGVYTDANVDRLYFASANGATPQLVTGSQNEALCFYVNAANNDVITYANKIITVNATGAITISSNVKAIGYGSPDSSTAVLFTTAQPTTTRNGKGYTIVKSPDLSVLDKMYVDTLPAPAGTYYIESSNTDDGLDNTIYTRRVVHVAEDGSVRILTSKLNNHFINIPVADVYNSMPDLIAGLTTINSYGFLSSVQDSGANTNYRLYHKASSDAPVVAASYYYNVRSSGDPALKNRLILVLPNGGVSTASFGNSGSVRRLGNQVTELAAEPMPIYSTNPKFQNFDYHVNGVVSLAETQLNTFNTELTARINAYNNAYTPLVAQIQPFFSAGAGTRWDATANFANAFNALKDSNTSLVKTGNQPSDKGFYATYTTNLNNYETAVNVLRSLTFGDANTVGLRQIQFNVLNNAPSGILHFRRESTFNTNALSTTTTDATLSNELAFVTAQMDQFLKALLVYQHGNSGTNFATTTVSSVQNTSLFNKSPTTDPNALSNQSLKYSNLSTQQKVLFDHVVNAVNLWFNSNIAGAAGGKQSWNELYAVNANIENAILNWGKANIFGYFEQNGAPTIYNQFVTKNQPNTVATLENIRSAMSVYETKRLTPETTATQADVPAQIAYINAATATTRVTQSNVTFDASSIAALISTDGNGKLRFNNATLNSVTKLYISLNDSNNNPINLTANGYFDEIQLNNGLAFSVKSVTKTDDMWELGVALVTGTTDNAAAIVTSFSTYQTLNLQWTLGNPLSPVATLSTMNDYVYRQYHIQNPAYSINGNNSISSIKQALALASTGMTTARNALLTSLEGLNNGIHQVVTNSIALNQAENKFMANMRSSSAGGSASVTATDVLNGAQMLARESELLKIALAATTTDSPTHAQIPSYAPEDGWFQTRVSNFWKNPTPIDSSSAKTAYTAAMVTFHTARENLQYAALESFIANTLASQTFTTPVTTFKLAEQAQAFSQNVPLHLVAGTPTPGLNEFAELVAERVSLYVLGRDLITQSITTNNDADKITARNNYQNKKITEAASAMMTARDAYGRAAYNRYLAVIDLAIVSGYLGTARGGALTNAFRTAMDQWNAASNNLKNGIFSNQIRSRLFDMVYSTDSLIIGFPLDVNGVISWFGNTQNGFLNSIIENGRDKANTLLNYNNFPLTKYQLLNLPRNLRQTFVYNNTTNVVQITASNSILVNGAQRIIISSTDPTTSSTSEQLTTTVFNARVNASISSIPPNPAHSFNPFNIAFSNTSADSVSSLRYTVVALGYASYASYASASPLLETGFGFSEITNSLFWNENVQNGVTTYSFKRESNFYYGIKQSSNVISSWARASPNQNVIIFYEGTNVPPTRLSASADNVNALCDDAKYVMIIDSNNHVSIYTYDVFGVTSGDLVAVGIIGSTQKLYEVVGALQKHSTNQNVKLAGSLTIPARLRTIGINAFSGSTQVQSLTFRSDQTNVNSVVIGSNAFQGCTLLPAINLGASIASIGPSAFLKCTGAASLALPPALQVANHWSFLGCNQIANDVALPNTLVQISVQSFANCIKMRCSRLNESLPDSVQRIGAGAFFRCVGLTGGLNFNTINDKGNFVSNLSVIGSAAFMGCSGLTGQLSLPINSNYRNVLPYTFASIDANLFKLDGDSSITNPNTTPVPMLLSGNVDFSVNKVTTVERNAFYRCVQLALVTLSNSITSVAQQAFMRCAGIQGNLAVPASVKIIGNEAFRACSGITGLNIVSTVVSQIATEAWLSLGSGCFQECTSIANSSTSSGLLIPNSVNSIGDSAFQGCTSLVNISVGSGLTRANSFGSSVFSGCIRLERVTFSFSYLSRDTGQSVVKNAQLPVPNPTDITYNASFTGCTALGVSTDTVNPAGTIQIQSGATGWTPGRAAFFNRLTIVINNRNITFYLKEFDQLAKINVVDPSKDPLQQEVVPTTDAQATVHIKASDMRKIFLVSTDSFVNTNAGNAEPSVGGQMFFVRPELLPRILNVANAQVVQGGIESYNAPVYEQLVKDDVMRYYAMSLFNSADWVTLFANDTEMIENMVASSGLMPLVPDGNTDENNRHLSNTGVLHNIMKELEKVGYENQTNMDLKSSANYPTNGTRWRGLPDSVLPENGNIGKKLFGMISRNDPNRINSMVLTGATPSELPFLPGDQFIFVFTLNENSVILNPSLPAVIVKKRTYLIRMILTDEFNSGNSTFLEHFNALYKPSALNQNIIPVGGAYAADYMYSNYNLYVAIKQNSQTSDSVYSRVTQNTYEPVPMPPQLLPFTGWFYNYKQNTQTIRLDFTPPDINNGTNKLRYNELKYLSAYVYFPDNWSSVTTLPSRNNFPQWVLTFSNDGHIYVFRYKANFLSKGAEVMNFLGQTGPFDFTNTHVQLLLAFDPTDAMKTILKGTNGGTRPEDSGTINTASGTEIYRQRNITTEFNNGLRMANSKVGPFTYPPIARGYQCIPMPSKEANGLQASQITLDGEVATITQQDVQGQTAVGKAISAVSDLSLGYRLVSAYLEVNMNNEDGFVPNIIVKSVEVVAQNYEAYYLAPLDPNTA